jgi:hypothetical protein
MHYACMSEFSLARAQPALVVALYECPPRVPGLVDHTAASMVRAVPVPAGNFWALTQDPRDGNIFRAPGRDFLLRGPISASILVGKQSGFVKKMLPKEST